MAEQPGGRRRTFGPVVLLGLAAGTLTAVAGEKPAVSASGNGGHAAVSSRLVSFDAHLPLVTALGLVVLACWGVVLVTRGRVRRAVAALGASPLSVPWWPRSRPTPRCPTQFRDELALGRRATTADLSHTAWYWAAVVGALLSRRRRRAGGRVGAVLARDGHPLRRPGERARRPSPSAPEEQSSLDLWKALDEGRDPTA